MSSVDQSARWKVACLGRAFAPAAQKIVRDLVGDVFDLSFDLDGSGAAAIVKDCDFIVCNGPVGAALIAGAPRLRLIHKWGIGVDLIDLDAAARHGVAVAITSGSNAVAVAEHTIMLTIAALRRLSFADVATRAGRWPNTELRPFCRQLSGKTVGILGFGNVGRQVAKRLQGFDVEILYHDVRRPDAETELRLNARYVPFEELIARSDILTLHIPGGAANRGLVDAGVIARMKRGAVLINAARGDVVDEQAVVAALKSGQLLAGGFDVYAAEPLPGGSALAGLDNVTMTPHSAAAVIDNVASTAEHAFGNLVRFARGEPLPAADVIVAPPAAPRAVPA